MEKRSKRGAACPIGKNFRCARLRDWGWVEDFLTAKEEKFAKEELFEFFTFLTWRLGGSILPMEKGASSPFAEDLEYGSLGLCKGAESTLLENCFHNSFFIRAPPCYPWFNFGFRVNSSPQAQRSQRNAEPCLWEDRKFGKPMELRNGGVRVDHPGIPCASGTCSYAAPNAKSGAGGEVLRNKNSHQRNLGRAAWRDTLTSNGSRSEIRNPPLPRPPV